MTRFFWPNLFTASIAGIESSAKPNHWTYAGNSSNPKCRRDGDSESRTHTGITAGTAWHEAETFGRAGGSGGGGGVGGLPVQAKDIRAREVGVVEFDRRESW